MEFSTASHSCLPTHSLVGFCVALWKGHCYLDSKGQECNVPLLARFRGKSELCGTDGSRLGGWFSGPGSHI